MADNNDVLEIVESNETGTITFANEVIATIASLAACEVKGVAGMCGNVADGFAVLLGRKNNSKGVKVEVGTKETAIECAINVKYGAKVQDVACDVQQNIKSAVENMTGLNVVQVNVSVAGIDTSDIAAAAKAEKEKEKEKEKDK